MLRMSFFEQTHFRSKLAADEAAVPVYGPGQGTPGELITVQAPAVGLPNQIRIWTGAVWQTIGPFDSQVLPGTAVYAAGNYTGSGGMTWTVDAVDQVAFDYAAIGAVISLATARMLWCNILLQNTSLTAPLGFDLYIALPGAYLPASPAIVMGYGAQGGVMRPCYIIAVAGNPLLRIVRIDGLVWAASVNTTDLAFQLLLRI